MIVSFVLSFFPQDVLDEIYLLKGRLAAVLLQGYNSREKKSQNNYYFEKVSSSSDNDKIHRKFCGNSLISPEEAMKIKYNCYCIHL